jgi:hypothetical protein
MFLLTRLSTYRFSLFFDIGLTFELDLELRGQVLLLVRRGELTGL